MGDDGNAGGIPPELMPTPVNYKELTMEELTKMVEDQKKMKGNILSGGISVLSPVVGGAIKVAMWNTTRQTKAEIIRRRDDPYTSEVDKRRYDSLLEISEREEPGLIATLFGRLTGNDPSTPAGRTDGQTEALMSQLNKMTNAYTPDVQEANTTTTPGVDDDTDYKAIGEVANERAKVKAFGTDKQKEAMERVDNAVAESNTISSNNNNNDNDDPPTFAPRPTTPTYTQPANDPYAEPGRPTRTRPGVGGGGKYKGGMMKKKKKKSK
jgi:hypothetical protein